MIELNAKPAQMMAATNALDHTRDDHSSRELMTRLIASDKTWRPVHSEWHKLSDNKADWDSLVALHAKDGSDLLRDRLETRYGLTPGAAEAVEALVNTHKRSSAWSTSSLLCSFSPPFAEPESAVFLNGGMAPDTPFVYVDVGPANERVLLPHLYQREPVPFVLLYGPRAASKTTHMLRALEQLPEFCCIQYVFCRSLVVEIMSHSVPPL
jgi:hypothetical protein